MRRAIQVLVVVLVALAAGVWLALRARGPSRDARIVAEQDAAPSRPSAELVDAPEPARREAAGHAAPAAAERAPPESAAALATSALVPTRATLVARAVAEGGGQPLAGARVVVDDGTPAGRPTLVEGPRGSFVEAPLTADDGRAELDVPAGIELRLRASGERVPAGARELSVPALAPGERREVIVRLPTEKLPYHVRVLSDAELGPVGGAGVEVLPSWGGPEPVARHETDGEGRLELSFAPWDSRMLRVEAAGFAPALLEVRGGHESAEDARTVLLRRTASLRARVVDASGTPLREVGVELSTEAYHFARDDEGPFVPRTDAPTWEPTRYEDDAFVFDALPGDAPLRVEIVREGEHATTLPSISLRPGEAREVEWRLGGGCTLEGTLLEAGGAPVAGQRVTLRPADLPGATWFHAYALDGTSREATTDSAGRFAFDEVRAGAWWVGPAPDEEPRGSGGPRAIAPVGERVEIPAGLARHEVTLRVHRGLYVRGRVIDPAGSPARQAFVHASLEGFRFGPSATAEEGAFALGPLAPGRYLLTASGGNHAHSEPVDALPGDEDVVLRLRRAGSLSGTVLDANGRPCAATVFVGHDGGRLWLARSDAGGAFRQDGLPAGTYSVAARAGAQLCGVRHGVRVSPDEETKGLVVTLAPGATVRLRFRGTRGFLQYRVRSDGATVALDGVAPGASAECAVPAGRLSVECRFDDEERTLEFDLAPGEERELDVGGE